MGKQNFAQLAFNRGQLSPLALGRIDQESRVLWGCEVQKNWMPRVLGSCMFRPGTEYVVETLGNKKARYIPFVFSINDNALVEFTDNNFQVLLNDEKITRPSVSSSVTNGNFTDNINSWSDNDEVGAVSTYSTGGFLQLLGTGENKAIRRQQITVAPADRQKEHGLRVEVARGEVTIKIGLTEGSDSFFAETVIGRGIHSLSFVPDDSFWIELSSDLNYAVLVDSVNIEAGGIMTVPTTIAESDLDAIRYDRSGDIIYLSIRGQQQKKIERRSERSWSFVYYEPKDGPFLLQNISSTTIKSSALKGNVTLTSNKEIFKEKHVGALFKLISSGQTVTKDLSASDTFTDTIRVTGVGDNRKFFVVITGTWAGTITLQRSFDEGASWEDVETYTANTNPTASPSINDSLDNQIILYRIGFDTDDYTSGVAVVSLQYDLGSTTGIARVNTFTDSKNVDAEVLKDFGSTEPTVDWSEGVWSDFRGYPSAVAFHEGRLWFSGVARYNGSVSDNYESFDEDVEGDSGPIFRTIGSGSVDQVNWLLSTNVLVMGTFADEKVIRANSFGDILTPNNTSIRTLDNIGSSDMPPVKIGYEIIFASGSQLFGMSTGATSDGEFQAQTQELTLFSPEITQPYITRLGIQRRPDTRIHCVLEDGNVAILVYSPAEGTRSWMPFEPADGGKVEDVVIYRGSDTELEERVYYLVKRTIDGEEKRYLEKISFENECQGGLINKLVDSSKTYSLGTSQASFTGLDHLEGKTVLAWGGNADANGEGTGKYLGEYTVSGGSITLSTDQTDTNVVNTLVVGLKYNAQMKSMKLPYASQLGTPLNQRKRLYSLGFVLHNTITTNLKYGYSFDNLDSFPEYNEGENKGDDYLWSHYDSDMMEFDGEYTTDPRIHIQAESPYPCTILAITAGIKTNDKG